MFKSIGAAAIATIAVVSFLQPPSVSAQDWSSNRSNSSYSVSRQNRSGNDDHATERERSNYGIRYSDVDNYGRYSRGNSSDRDGNRGSYDGRESVTNHGSYRETSQLRYGGQVDSWSASKDRR